MSQTANSKAKEPEAMRILAVVAPPTDFATSVLQNNHHSRTEYHYTPLNSPSNFRTLEVEPGQRESDIHCSLREGSPGDGTVYYALSYVWGPPVFPHKVYCQDGTLLITENLFTALRNYRRADQPVIMWVDAICINQEDMAERTQQVLLMQKIYSKSKQLWIWLGEDSECCSEALQHMSDILVKKSFQPGPDVQNTDLVADMINTMWNKTTGDEIRGLEKLFNKPWFRRAWTFQEVVCGPHAEISIGNLMWPFDILSDWAIVSKRFGIPECIFSPSAQLAMDQAAVIKSYKTERGELFPMAINMRVRLATDAWDKIYSLMGIATNLDSIPFRPDYNIVVDTLYRDFAVHTITNSGDLDLLKFCNNIDPGPSKPSWVVDWQDWKHSTYDINQNEHPFCASGNPTAEACINGCKLLVDGLLVERVAIIAKSDVLRINEETKDNEGPYRVAISARCKTYEEIVQIVHWSQRSNPEEVRSQALWRTLVGGRLGDRSRVFPEAQEHVLDCFRTMQRIDSDWENQASLPEQDILQQLSIQRRFRQIATGRRFLKTESGRMGWVPERAIVGDLVSVLCGSAVPVLLRSCEDAFRVIGQCYVEGIMDGEAVEAANEPMRQIVMV